jgi:hypothetical protein
MHPEYSAEASREITLTEQLTNELNTLHARLNEAGELLEETYGRVFGARAVAKDNGPSPSLRQVPTHAYGEITDTLDQIQSRSFAIRDIALDFRRRL